MFLNNFPMFGASVGFALAGLLMVMLKKKPRKKEIFITEDNVDDVLFKIFKDGEKVEEIAIRHIPEEDRKKFDKL